MNLYVDISYGSICSWYSGMGICNAFNCYMQIPGLLCCDFTKLGVRVIIGIVENLDCILISPHHFHIH